MMDILHYQTMQEIDRKMSKIKEFLALKNAQKAELENKYFEGEITLQEYSTRKTALDMDTSHLKLMNGKIMNANLNGELI